MRVTVVGSYDDHLSKRNKDSPASKPKVTSRFEEACAAIGTSLAKSGHRLVVAHSERSGTAEAIALEAFQKIAPYRFYQCIQHEGDADLKAHLDAVEMSDVVILIGGGNGTYASGLSALRRRKVMIPVPAFGGSAKDLCEIPEIDKVVEDRLRNLDFRDRGWKTVLTFAIGSVLRQFPKVLIIHGRGDSGIELQEQIARESETGKELEGLAKPIIMDLAGFGAVTVPEVFEEFASQVSAAIVVVTADDIGGFARRDGEPVSATELVLQVRARENVWVEVGWFWGRLGRQRILLWLQDAVGIPSDLQGVARGSDGSLGIAWPSIRSFLTRMRDSEPVLNIGDRDGRDVAAPVPQEIELETVVDGVSGSVTVRSPSKKPHVHDSTLTRNRSRRPRSRLAGVAKAK